MSPISRPAGQPRRGRVWVAGAGLVLLLAVGAAILRYRQPSAPVPAPPARSPVPDPLELVLADESMVSGQWTPAPEETRQGAAGAVAAAVAEAARNPWPPLPTTAGPTPAERRARESDWMKRFFVESYVEAGRHDPSWDDAAKAFLAAAAARVTEKPNDMAHLQILDAAAAALGAKACQDPWVLYWRGNIRDCLDGPAAAEPLLRQALPDLAASRYPRLMPFFAARRLSQALARQRGFEDAEVQEVRRRMYVHFGEAAGDPAVREEGGRDMYARELSFLLMAARKPGEMAPAAEAAATLTEADPWASAMVRQMYHFELGWRARRHGWADTVTAAGAQEFQTHLQKAYDICFAAWQQVPNRPELPGRLLEISRPLCGGDSERLWFERAVAAQFDYMPAYRSMLLGLMPRWGGSLAALLAFGDALQKTQRYDTAVPFQALRSGAKVAEELGEDWREVWRAESVAAWSTEVCRQYAGKDLSVIDLQEEGLVALEAGLLWAAGRYQAAHERVATLQYGLRAGALSEVLRLARPDVIETEVAIGIGRRGEVLREALQRLDQGDLGTAQRLLASFAPQDADEASAWTHLLERACGSPLDPRSPTGADQVAILSRLHRREALLLAYVRVAREHGEESARALAPAVTAEIGPMALAFAPTVPPVGDLGRADLRQGLAQVDQVADGLRGAGAAPPGSAEEALLETHRALARLRWLLRAQVSHERSPCELYASRVVGHEVRRCAHKGLLLDFMGEWLRAEMMSDTLASYVGQIVHDSVVLAGDRRREDVEKQVAELASVADPNEVDRRGLELFLNAGTPRLNLRLAHALAGRERYATAAILDRRTRSWMWRFFRATESLQVWSPWQCMAAYNRVEGYENEVLFYGEKAIAYRALNSSYYICAAASLRRGWVPAAVWYLLAGRAFPDDADEFEDPDGVYQGTGAYVTRLIEQILRSGRATEKECAALREAFPAQYASAAAAAAP